MDVVPDDEVEAVEAVDGVHLTQGAAGENASIQRFYIEPGAEVPVHDHPHEQVGTVTQGTLTFVVDDEDVPVHAGDTFAIPGDEPHGAVNRGDVPVEGFDVFSPARPNPDWGE
ncbi:cupin domain-containing protein [Halorubrum sp. JWXQ-INN 858]|uniref:cupin domain-containing protein n=1 Tax=Halorubrum sp. JWXQ-INN 858 TaxID=2690782 RepID=UPI001359B9D5|nr:cupin domain-containing protein [Halorubrum sp. JWXQ-INN 858]MWV64864.1 cupin domain-containing protein [Halorubrum sp. JWXQ-INN 858]